MSAQTSPDGEVTLEAPRLPRLVSAPPSEFGGPGDRWSPETLLTGAVADCFALTFRAVARASQLRWTSLGCQVEGVLERIDRVTRFTGFVLKARLLVPEGVDVTTARRALEKTEQTCLVSRSLNAGVRLEAEVTVGNEGQVRAA